jgi:hypothetical protein
MSKTSIKTALACMACLTGMTFFGCTNEEDETATENNQRVEQIKNKILVLADDYGLENIQIDEVKLKNDPSVSDEQIKNDLQILSSIRGNYKLSYNKKSCLLLHVQKYPHLIKRKLSESNEASMTKDSTYIGDPYFHTCYNTPTNSIILDFTISFSYNKNNIDLTYVNISSASLRYYIRDDDTSTGAWITNSISCESPTFNFTGVVPSFTFSSSFEMTLGELSYKYYIRGSYDTSGMTSLCISDHA